MLTFINAHIVAYTFGNFLQSIPIELITNSASRRRIGDQQ